jgi:hypothetical protein
MTSVMLSFNYTEKLLTILLCITTLVLLSKLICVALRLSSLNKIQQSNKGMTEDVIQY